MRRAPGGARGAVRVHGAAEEFSTPARDAFGEHLSFIPWHALPEHKPLGAVNRIRRVVYASVSKLRHQHNGVARREPEPDDVA